MEKLLLKTLLLQNFRNIEELKLQPHPAFNFFFGENAQGKTALLESIYFLSELRSFRTPDLSSLIRHGTDVAQLSAQIESEGLLHDLKVVLRAESKDVSWNGKTPRPYRVLRRKIPVVLFTPESVRLFRSSPGERRQYFDQSFGLLSEAFAKDVEEYGRIVRQKKELLEQLRTGSSALRAQKEIWDERLIEWGARVARERICFTEALKPLFNAHFERLSGKEWKAEIQYQSHLAGLHKQSETETLQGLYRDEVRRREAEEIERGQVLVGPHRDDWEILLEGIGLKEEGSQGQHRIAVAALKLAELEGLRRQDFSPLTLFDDLLSELDERRIRMVLEELALAQGQVFLTSIAPGGISLGTLGGSTYQIRDGKVVQ